MALLEKLGFKAWEACQDRFSLILKDLEACEARVYNLYLNMLGRRLELDLGMVFVVGGYRLVA